MPRKDKISASMFAYLWTNSKTLPNTGDIVDYAGIVDIGVSFCWWKKSSQHGNKRRLASTIVTQENGDLTIIPNNSKDQNLKG